MQSKRPYGDAFISEANEKIVSVIAKETGFDGVQKKALQSFSNALGSYFEQVFSKAHRFAELGNRSRPNIYDMTRSLEDAGLDTSTFQSYIHAKLNDSATLQKTNRFFKTNPKPSTLEKIPTFLPSDNEDSEEEEEEGEGGMPPYVPRHLPTFPSKHSFRQTPIYINRPDDPQKVRELNSEQSRTVEENLKKLMAAENKLLRQQQSNGGSLSALYEASSMTDGEDSMMMPIVNYEVFLQRRKRQKQSGITLNVEEMGDPKKKENTTDLAEEMADLDATVDHPETKS